MHFKLEFYCIAHKHTHTSSRKRSCQFNCIFDEKSNTFSIRGRVSKEEMIMLTWYAFQVTMKPALWVCNHRGNQAVVPGRIDLIGIAIGTLPTSTLCVSILWLMVSESNVPVPVIKYVPDNIPQRAFAVSKVHVLFPPWFCKSIIGSWENLIYKTRGFLEKAGNKELVSRWKMITMNLTESKLTMFPKDNLKNKFRSSFSLIFREHRQHYLNLPNETCP